MSDTQALANAVNALAALLSSIFTLPDASQLSQAFGLGLIAPLTFYLVAYFVGQLVNFWSK